MTKKKQRTFQFYFFSLVLLFSPGLLSSEERSRRRPGHSNHLAFHHPPNYRGAGLVLHPLRKFNTIINNNITTTISSHSQLLGDRLVLSPLCESIITIRQLSIVIYQESFISSPRCWRSRAHSPRDRDWPVAPVSSFPSLSPSTLPPMPPTSSLPNAPTYQSSTTWWSSTASARVSSSSSPLQWSPARSIFEKEWSPPSVVQYFVPCRSGDKKMEARQHQSNNSLLVKQTKSKELLIQKGPMM